jgi:hypothetical protein
MLYRTTRDLKWRELGWDMFLALERYTRYSSGYSSIKYVDEGTPVQINEMPRFVQISVTSIDVHAFKAMLWPKLLNISTYFASE